jgi:hypothetical protein
MHMHKIMHLHNTHLSEISLTTRLSRDAEARVNAAGGCEHDAFVGSTTRGLIRRSG